MTTESKKHHYVPQSVLKRFSIDGREQSIFVFDKMRDEVRREAIPNTGMENHFNTVIVNGVRENFEAEFDAVDGALAGAHRRVVETREALKISPMDMDAILDGVAAQLLRTKLYRTSLKSISEGVLSAMAEAGFPEPGFTAMDEQTARVLARDAVRDRSRERNALAEKRLILIEPEPGASFWISDNPVVRFNSFPYGDTGISSPGVEIYCPIAADLVLGFYCRTLVDRIAAIHALGDQIPEPERSQAADLHRAFTLGQPTQLRRGATAGFLNRLQVRSSSRFVYGAHDDFGLAREILSADPKLRNVQSAIRVGKIGQGPPRRQRMPAGLHLVVYGRDGHHMLPLQRIEDNAFWGFDALTSDGTMAAAIMRDEPWHSVSVFNDGLEMRMMRMIRAEMVREGEDWRIQVRQDLGGENGRRVAK